MKGYSLITIRGNLGTDPESRFTTSGKRVVGFRLAVNKSWGDKEIVNWYRVNTFDAELCELVMNTYHKGAAVEVSGDLTVNEFVRKDGTKGYSLDVFMNDIRPIEFNKQEAVTEEEIPF